jgi:serine/threonine protein kinase
MTHVDSPSLTVPPFWAELYFDTRDADGARLREILAGDPRLRLAGFADFLEQERLRLKTLSIYAVGVLIVEVGGQGGADEPPGSRPWPVEPTTALHLVELLRGRAGRISGLEESAGQDRELRLSTLLEPLSSAEGEPDGVLADLPEEPSLVGNSLGAANGSAIASDEASSADATLRHTELRSSVSPQHEQAQTPSRPQSGTTGFPNRLPIPADSVPSRIGDCRIVRQIGQGGMGVVYLGQHVLLDRLVAIKVLPVVLFHSPEARDRLVREARIGARLRHSNICQILDAGQEGGEFYFVMEYVEGESLQEVLRREGPLPIPRVCDLALQLFRAVKYLGHRGIVHRDIKPANLMVALDGRLKLLDLGVAKATGESQGLADVTQTGEMIGTPAYMAPEQVSNTRGVSVAADLYGAGTTLFEMLTGQRPFSGRAVMEVVQKILNEPPPDPRQFRPDLPSVLADLILRLLDKTPRNRPGPDEVLQVLRRFVSTPYKDRRLADEEECEDDIALRSSGHTAQEPVGPSGTAESSVVPSFLGRISSAVRHWKDGEGDELIDLLRGPDGEARLGEYTLKERLGLPSAISTYRAEMPHSGVSCVVRVFPPAFGQLAPERLRELLREQGLLMRVSTRSSHLSGLTFLGRAELKQGALRTVYYTVENFHEGQSLDKLIEARELLGISEARRALFHAVSALVSLHDEKIIHGNVHTGKILLDLERRDLCIVDLSRARRIDEGEPSEPATLAMRTIGGLNKADFRHQDSYRRRQYLAPEILCDQRPHSLASEQYALSVAFIEALTGGFIRTDEDDLKLLNLVRAELEDRLDEIAEDAPRFAHVLRKMVKPNAGSRYDDLRNVRDALLIPMRHARPIPIPSRRRSDPAPEPFPFAQRERSNARDESREGRGPGLYDIFLSYRRESGAYAARAIFEALQRRGYRVFLDVDRLKSGRFDTKLLLHIQNTPNFVVIMSEGALDRCQDREDWLRKEIAHAIHCRCNVLPVMMPGFEMPKPMSLPHNLRKLPTFHAIHYQHEHHDGVIEQLRQFIRTRFQNR